MLQKIVPVSRKACRRCGGEIEHSPEDDWSFLPKPNAWRCTVCGRLENVAIVGATVKEVAATIDEMVTDAADLFWLK